MSQIFNILIEHKGVLRQDMDVSKLNCDLLKLYVFEELVVNGEGVRTPPLPQPPLTLYPWIRHLIKIR